MPTIKKQELEGNLYFYVELCKVCLYLFGYTEEVLLAGLCMELNVLALLLQVHVPIVLFPQYSDVK